MTARIYLPARNAMQAGQAKDKWILEYEPESPRQTEPLMGWTSSSDMRSQVNLRFDSKEEAIAYADAHRPPLPGRGAEAGDPQARCPIPTISAQPADRRGRIDGEQESRRGSVAQLDRAAAF